MVLQSDPILVADNDTAIADFLVELLTEEGYIVYSAPMARRHWPLLPCIRPR